MEISFPLEYQAPQWKYKPATFISHLLGHEGSRSLLSYLKKKRWATSISSGPQSLARGFAMFKLTINMTKSGFRRSTLSSKRSSPDAFQRTIGLLFWQLSSICRCSAPQNSSLIYRKSYLCYLWYSFDFRRNSGRTAMRRGSQNEWRGLCRGIA